jgi:hypothetical protein
MQRFTLVCCGWSVALLAPLQGRVTAISGSHRLEPGTNRLRMRSGIASVTCLAILALAANGCAVTYAPRSRSLSETDGVLWLPGDEIQHYRCDVGVLMCDNSISKLAERLCRCVR